MPTDESGSGRLPPTHWLREVPIAKATKLPIILYNVPTRTACDLLTETVVRLADFPNIVGIKDATGNLVRGSELVARVGDRMAVLSGDDGTAFPLYAVGARGVISVVSNVAPRAMSDMWDAAKAGDWDRARKRHHELRVLKAKRLRTLEELRVFRIRAGVPALDVVDAELINLERDLDLVLDRE